MLKNSLRILQLGKSFPLAGGVEKVMYDLTTGLAEYGVECDMLCAALSGETNVLQVAPNSNIITCRTICKVAATTISPAMIGRLIKICNDYDIIHIHHPEPMGAMALWCSGYKGRVILHWHSDIVKQKNLLKLYMPLQNWLLRRADMIVGTSPVYIKESPHLRNFQDKAVVLPIGIEPMKPNHRAAAAIRQRYGNRKIVYSLGRLVPYKGYRYLVEAASYLTDDFVVLIGSSGPLRDELQAQIDSLHLQGRVHLLGRIKDEEMASYYEACDIFCLSSTMKNEAFGIVQIEAMQWGKPIVATRIPESGVRWVNEHGVSGLNVEIEDAHALANAILTIANAPELYARYSEGARRRYETFFTKDKMIKDCLKLYSQLFSCGADKCGAAHSLAKPPIHYNL